MRDFESEFYSVDRFLISTRLHGRTVYYVSEAADGSEWSHLRFMAAVWAEQLETRDKALALLKRMPDHTEPLAIERLDDEPENAAVEMVSHSTLL